MFCVIKATLGDEFRRFTLASINRGDISADVAKLSFNKLYEKVSVSGPVVWWTG